MWIGEKVSKACNAHLQTEVRFSYQFRRSRNDRGDCLAFVPTAINCRDKGQAVFSVSSVYVISMPTDLISLPVRRFARRYTTLTLTAKFSYINLHKATRLKGKAKINIVIATITLLVRSEDFSPLILWGLKSSLRTNFIVIVRSHIIQSLKL